MEKTEKKMFKKINDMEKSGKLTLELSMPIKVDEYNGEQYLLVIRDANDVYQYFNKDGSYDGCCRPCK